MVRPKAMLISFYLLITSLTAEFAIEGSHCLTKSQKAKASDASTNSLVPEKLKNPFHEWSL
jgi:hypothetical protein